MKENEIIKLSDLKVNEKCEILGFSFNREGIERLESLGIKKGEKITSLRIAPYSHTVIIAVGGRLFALRGETAEGVLVKRV